MIKITEIFAEDNAVIERDATEEEAAQMIADQDAAKAAKEAEEIANAEKAAAKAALLERLGITADEAALLLS
jgi:hypothetical protein